MRRMPVFRTGLLMTLLVLSGIRADQVFGGVRDLSPEDTYCLDIIPDCTDPRKDFACRDQLEPCDECPSSCDNCATKGTWGPHQTKTNFKAPTVPTGCDPISWKQSRLLASLNFWIDKAFNYCHHHIPDWLPPDDTLEANPKFRVTNLNNSGMTCTPNRYLDGSQHNNKTLGSCDKNQPNCVNADIPAQIQFQGLDCSDFTSWVYNFTGLSGEGRPLQTDIDAQACDQQENDGVLLDINRRNFNTYKKLLRPGDLLYIMAGQNSLKPSTKMVHVVVWTGKKWSDIQTDPAYYKEQDGKTFGQAGDRVGGDFLSYGKVSPDTPLIVDSHFAGPAYRPFLGWYVKNLSHVRRIIKPDLTDLKLKKLVMTSTCKGNTCTVKSSLKPSYSLKYTYTSTTAYCGRPADF